MKGGPPNRPPLSPKEAWISDGRQVLHFRPVRWVRWSQRQVVTSGELLPDQSVSLLKCRFKLSREEGLKLWAEKLDSKAGPGDCRTAQPSVFSST
jgi:hypothetical protein